LALPGRRSAMPLGQQESPLEEAAASLGLRYVPSPLDTPAESRGPGALFRGAGVRDRMAVGPIDGVGVRVLECSNRARLLYYYCVDFQGPHLGLKIRREAWWRRPLRVLRLNFGSLEPRFEDLVWVRSADPVGTDLFLTPERRRLIVEAIGAVRNIMIRDDRLDGFEALRRLRRPAAADVVARIRQLVAVAQALAG
jgi:hypothetical protein